MAFQAWQSGGNRNIWPGSFHLPTVISMDNGLAPVISYSFFFWLSYEAIKCLLLFSDYRTQPNEVLGIRKFTGEE